MAETTRPSGSLFEVIEETTDLLVINKPPGLVCHPTKTDEYSSLIGRVRLYLGAKAHLVNRLDRETSGVVLVARNSAVAGELGKLWESRAVDKEYLAIVHGHVQEEHRLIDAPLGKDESSQIAIKDCVRPDGAPAQTEYWLERLLDYSEFATQPAQPAPPPDHVFSLLRVIPYTGRKHQIRIHLAHIDHPIVGDKLYGGDEDLYLALVENRLTSSQLQRLILPFHALHCRRISLSWRGEPRSWIATRRSWL